MRAQPPHTVSVWGGGAVSLGWCEMVGVMSHGVPLATYSLGAPERGVLPPGGPRLQAPKLSRPQGSPLWGPATGDAGGRGRGRKWITDPTEKTDTHTWKMEHLQVPGPDGGLA